MHWLQIVRLVLLSVALLCSVIVVAISAHITAFTAENFDVYYNFAALGIASGAITLISLVIMLIVDAVRTGAFTSLVVVELAWLSILWVLWIATGALTADQTSAVFSNCQYTDPIINQFCHETQSVEAFSFVAWIALMSYTIILVVVALVNANRGIPIWTSTVRQSPPVAPATSNGVPANGQPQGYQQQQLLHSQTPPYSPPTQHNPQSQPNMTMKPSTIYSSPDNVRNSGIYHSV